MPQSPLRSRIPRIMQQQHPLLTVRETASMLGFSEMTIRRRIAAREFPAVKIGSKAMVPRAFVQALIAQAADGNTVLLEEFAEEWTARALASRNSGQVTSAPGPQQFPRDGGEIGAAFAALIALVPGGALGLRAAAATSLGSADSGSAAVANTLVWLLEQAAPLLITLVILALAVLAHRIGRKLSGGLVAPPATDRIRDAGDVHLGWLLIAVAVGTAVLCATASRLIADLGLALGLAAGSVVAGGLCAHHLVGDRRPGLPPPTSRGRRWMR